MSDTVADRLEAGVRVGRFVIVRDIEGRAHAVAAGIVAAMCDGTTAHCCCRPAQVSEQD